MSLLNQPLLLIGVVVLLLGPLLYRLVQQRPGWMALTDSFVFVVIGGLVSSTALTLVLLPVLYRRFGQTMKGGTA